MRVLLLSDLFADLSLLQTILRDLLFARDIRSAATVRPAPTACCARLLLLLRELCAAAARRATIDVCVIVI
jgi:hypothetical protein